MSMFDAYRNATLAVLDAMGLDPSCVISHTVEVDGDVVSVDAVERDGKGRLVRDESGVPVKCRRYYRLTAEELPGRAKKETS